MTQITLIAAIGQRGQLGLRGELPWASNFGHAYREDLRRFREVTTGGLVIVGHRTWPNVKHLDDTYGRVFVADDLRRHPVELTEAAARRFHRSIFIAGGAKTYARWLRHITDFDVTLLPYDGEADVYAEFLLPHVTRTTQEIAA